MTSEEIADLERRCDNLRMDPRMAKQRVEVLEGELRQVGVGKGWNLFVGVAYDDISRRRLSPEAKGKIRRRALAKRVQAKAPLFADQIIADKLAAQPDYYSGIEVSA